MQQPDAERLLNTSHAIITGSDSRNEKLAAICRLLHDEVEHYDWVGFYLTDDTGENLALGPYIGDATNHTLIMFGQGICGQAADREETFVVQDITKETNYLSCSPVVKSEIVVPIMKNGKVIGELDIDSHVLSPFTDADTVLLEGICESLTQLF